MSLRTIPGKGLGLVARRDLPAHTIIGMYAGQVYRSQDHQRLVKNGLADAKYTIDFFKHMPDGRVDAGYIMDPANEMKKKHSNVLAAFINEPSDRQRPNVVWVRNYDSNTMQLWTMRPVKKGEELTACYGAEYPRRYTTSCTRRPQFLHFYRRGMVRPQPV